MATVRLDPAKFARRAAAAGGEYAAGVQSPRKSQSQQAIASKENWLQGVQEAGARDAYAKGLQKSGDSKWQQASLEKGRSRFQQGVSLAESAYAEGMRPFVSALQALNLQPRGPKGQNYGRVQQVGDALRQAKLGGA